MKIINVKLSDELQQQFKTAVTSQGSTMQAEIKRMIKEYVFYNQNEVLNLSRYDERTHI